MSFVKKKPILRWTIGPVSEAGFKCLNLSYKLLKKQYEKKFRYIICYNGLSKEQIAYLPNIEKIDQEKISCPFLPNIYEYKDYAAVWKLYPPRMDLDVHEIILDNDVVIYGSLFDKFLAEDKIYITEAFTRSYSPNLERFIPENFNVNVGVVCLPPGFDFQKNLSDSIEFANIKNWENFFDDQSLTAMSIYKEKPKIIPLSDLFVCAKNLVQAKYGLHFVGLNRNQCIYWNKFLSQILQ
jgi:hypothetical protein